MADLLRSYVGGAFVATAGEPFDDLNPSDSDDVVARVPAGNADDAAAAVRAAAQALPAWRDLPGPTRAEHLHRWGEVIAARAEELAQAMAREVGKPLGEARGEVARCTVILRYYAGEAVRAIGEVVPAQAAGVLQFTLREPLGVVALITPWNFPLAIPLWKAAPALAFGNTVVLKPAEQSSHLGVLLAETAQAAGLPPGVFNVVAGAGASVGDALIRHPDVRAVSFTGSTTVGGHVAQVCAERNIRYQTVMGGKNVAIVLADADLDLAARLTAAGAMRYAGQKCTATSRVVVARSVEDRFLAKLAAQVNALPLGPVTDPASAVGPLISGAARDRVRAALATAGGERIAAATRRPTPASRAASSYRPPSCAASGRMPRWRRTSSSGRYWRPSARPTSRRRWSWPTGPATDSAPPSSRAICPRPSPTSGGSTPVSSA
jgi:aldehyde dehydrogenase (NAD+)